MKDIKEYITEKKTTGAGSINMVQNILDELTTTHSDCHWDNDKKQWVGKDKDLWDAAGQFLYDYLKELSQADLTNLVKHFGWPIDNVDNVSPAQISFCMASELLEKTK